MLALALTAVLAASTPAPTPTPGPAPTPAPLIVTQPDGYPVYGEQLAQTGNSHYTITAHTPSGLIGTWALTDDAPSQITGPTVDADNTARWDWVPWEFYTHHLTATFHPNCAAQPCPPDVVATGSYYVFEAYPTPSPTPTPTPSPTPTPTPVALPSLPPGLSGPALALWQALIGWLLGRLHGLPF